MAIMRRITEINGEIIMGRSLGLSVAGQKLTNSE